MAVQFWRRLARLLHFLIARFGLCGYNTMQFPENFDLLHGGEELIRNKSKITIQQNPVMLHHASAIATSMNLIEHFARAYPHQDEDQLIVQLLGIRLFNGMAGAMKNLMAGYYQNAIMMMRDLLEVSFLLDYFYRDKSQIAIWKNCAENERNKLFSAVKIRTTLDDQDGFTLKKRMEHYQLLCNLGTHASFQGFELLRPVAGGDANCGPYFAERALLPTISELAKIAVGAAGNFTMFFEPHEISDYETKLHFMEVNSAWFKEFFGQAIDVGIPGMRRLLEIARAARR